MRNPSNAPPDVGVRSGFRLSFRDRRHAQAALAELSDLGAPRVNLLVAGSDAVTGYLLDALYPYYQLPIHVWQPGEQLVLPLPRAATLILCGVGALRPGEQRRLYEWLGQAGHQVQVVCTTPRSLVPDVEAGTFMPALYYRLNVIFVGAAP
jgi:hypothetical protein